MTGPSRRFAAQYALAIGAVALAMGCAPQGILGTSGAWKRGTTMHFLSVGATPRQYLLHVPERRPVRLGGTIRSYSLVLVLHGSSSNGDDIRQISHMDSLSEARRFVVAYPYGTSGGGLGPSDWNGGVCCGAPARNNVDDVGFLAAIVAEASKNLPVDPHRIYIMGFSSGAIMAYHAACRLAPTIAAIGIISGSLMDDSCAPARPVEMVGIHGTSDDQVPYGDPSLTPPPKPVTGVATQLPSSAQFWVATDGCALGAAVYQSPHVVRTTFKTCTGAQVLFFTIVGGTHGWPESSLTPPMSELEASSVIAEYFDRQVAR